MLTCTPFFNTFRINSFQSVIAITHECTIYKQANRYMCMFLCPKVCCTWTEGYRCRRQSDWAFTWLRFSYQMDYQRSTPLFQFQLNSGYWPESQGFKPQQCQGATVGPLSQALWPPTCEQAEICKENNFNVPFFSNPINLESNYYRLLSIFMLLLKGFQ